LVPGREYIFSFSLQNPSSTQISPALSISTADIESCQEGNDWTDASACSTHISETAIDKDLTTILQDTGAVAGDAAPLRVAAPGFSLAKIAQNSCLFGAKNTITVSFALNFDLDADAHTYIVVRGLNGTGTRSGVYEALQNESTACFGTHILFEASTGTVWMNATLDSSCNRSALLPAGAVLSFAFEVTNARVQQISGVDIPAATATISIANRAEAGEEPLTATLENDVSTVLSNIIGALPGDAAPLRLRTGWAQASIRQSSSWYVSSLL
jgi:hypothetical protein